MMNAVAMAISGYSEDKHTLWKKTCSSLLHKLTDPYLRAIFAFLSCEKEDFQEILVRYQSNYNCMLVGYFWRYVYI
jgi:hypothetical protein